MKAFLGLLFISLSLEAKVIIQEEIYVPNESPEVVRELISSGSVIVDHVTSEGFELYGPTGMMGYLDQKNVFYLNRLNTNKSALANYPTHQEITQSLQKAVAKRPGIMKLFSIGKSVRGKELWVVKISDNVNTDEVEPEFKYISSMHGDEITGRELTVKLIEEIAEKYGYDKEITELVNNTEIFIMPSMNPDGSESKRRANASGVDLNRNFPDWLTEPKSSLAGREIENVAVMQFQAERQFALSANFHGGTIVANYPWDATYDRHPLDELIKEFSTIYAELNPEMRNSGEFPGGITNGADWYKVKGGMQDWSYFYYNDLQITVELSHDKYPRYEMIPDFYRSNRDSMVKYMQLIHRGAGIKIEVPNVGGIVKVKQLSPVVKEMGSFAFRNSEFYKVLPDGEYEFSVTDNHGHKSVVKTRVDQRSMSPNGNYVVVR